MKKLMSLSLSIVLCSVLCLMIVFSLTACTKQEVKNSHRKGTASTEEFKPKEVTIFTDILDNLGNKDYFYSDTTGNTIKILDKAPFKAYSEKSYAITKKAMADNKVDMTNTKVYNFYRNVNGQRMQKNYVVAYNANKIATALYEVTATIDEKDEPALKEAKRIDNTVDDNFKKLFEGEVK